MMHDDDRYGANAAWQANFERMAQRAARDPGYYEIAGCNVQARADELRADGGAA